MTDGERHPTKEDLAQRVAEGSERFTALPTPPEPDELVETSDSSPAPDPNFGRDPDLEWLLKYGAG
jgi:hypothetical protein